MRLWWMLVGNAALAFVSLAIAQASGVTWRDAVLWCCAGSISAARFADVRWFGGTTAAGAPASLRHWRRHTLIVFAAAAVAWAAAHGLQFLLR